MTKNIKIGIVGAGVGGLTTAIALQQKGFRVVVYEQSSELGEIGAGLTISINAGRVLAALGLGQQFCAMDAATPHLGAVDYETGERLSYELRDHAGNQSQFGAATRQVHRADLHNLLADNLHDKNATIFLDHRLSEITQSHDQVSLKFKNGKSDQCDYVIACDGLKSFVRQQLFSSKPAEFTGFVAWRGLVNRDHVPDVSLDPHFATYSSQSKLFTRYPVRHGSLVNYVAIARKLDFRSERWNEPAEVQEVAAQFSGWHEDVTKIILATPRDKCNRWALYTREPLNTWHKDRVVLLGDAAHPMTPFYGMGAAMAIEDGMIISRCLEAEPNDWQAAMGRYQQARLERCNNMQQISLARANDYMHPDKKSRALAPGAGMAPSTEYDPVTIPI